MCVFEFGLLRYVRVAVFTRGVPVYFVHTCYISDGCVLSSALHSVLLLCTRSTCLVWPYTFI